jgi:hypothetical protein
MRIDDTYRTQLETMTEALQVMIGEADAAGDALLGVKLFEALEIIENRLAS